MRHGKKFNHLSRTSAHRKAMLANMACSLIEHKRIKTTLAKAKALRVFVEPLITKSKNDTTHSRRIVFSSLKQKEAITELFSDVATKVAERSGGYTRILKLSNRLGDNAQMAYIELVDYNEDYTTDKPKRKKARRARNKKKNIDNVASETSTETTVKDEAPVSEVAAETTVKDEAPVSETSPETTVKDEAPVSEVAAETTVKDEDPVSEVSEENTVKDEVNEEIKNPENKEVKGE